MISIERLKEVFSYDPESGYLRWIKSTGKGFHMHIGDIAGTIGEDGYIQIIVDHYHLRAHRIIYAMMTGSFPENDIDHINGNRADNRWFNLRPVTRGENARNKKCHRNGKLVGVSYDKRAKRYYSRIYRNGKCKHLGMYGTEIEAHNAYMEEIKTLDA